MSWLLASTSSFSSTSVSQSNSRSSSLIKPASNSGLPPPRSPSSNLASTSAVRSNVRPTGSSKPPTSGSRSTSTLNQLSAPANGTINQKTKAIDSLRKHYGLGVGPPPPKPVGSNSQDPMDMNSLAFDAKSYYEQLITTASLPILLKKENDLLTEIRHLEGERQSLVYNHHHELIAASDTISAMKTRAEGLDGDLDLLRAAFSEISRLTAEVSVEQTRKPED